MASYDPVYEILKLLEEDKKPDSELIGLNERDFNIALYHIHEAGYVGAAGLNQTGLDYITGHERRIKDLA